MRDYVIFNGINTADFGCYAANVNQFDAPARDVESIKVPGKNGVLTIDNGRYQNQTMTYLLYTRGDIQTQIMGLRNAITQGIGYKRLEDSFNPNEFYLARFIDGFAVSQSDKYRAGFNMVFDRKPQRYLKSGEDPLPEFTANSSIYNQTNQIAKPLIRVYGTGQFAIGGAWMTISSANVYTDIDCELQDAFKGTTNCNGNVSGTFPVLNPGANAITIGTVSKIIITPRWWIL